MIKPKPAALAGFVYSGNMSTRSIGNHGEEVAVAFLEKLGWQIVARNAHLGFGEIDILADSGDYLVIVEVKAKKTAYQGYAVEMITAAKKQVLRRLAKMVQTRYNKPVRVDVVAIDNYAATPKITHYPFAIEE